MDSNTADALFHQFNLTSMKANTNLQSHAAGFVAERLGTANGAGRTIKGRQTTIACGLHITTAKTADFFGQHAKVTPEQISPAAIPHFCQTPG